MNPAQSLHTAARRYCQEQFHYWATEYSKLANRGGNRNGDNYTPAALSIFPRYNVLRAIRVELERVDPAALNDLEELRSDILFIGAAAEDLFTRPPNGPIEVASIAEEREAFGDFIRGLTDWELHSVEPLPYQRVLSQPESESLWSKLRKRWQISESYWYPLAECGVPNVAAFQDRDFNEFRESFDLTRMFSSRGISRVWEVREYGPDYEQELSLFNPCYNGAEGYWTSEDLEWIIYASHEGSVTVGGWLLDEIKRAWPKWSQCVWHSPFF